MDRWVIMKSWSEIQMIETNPNLKKETEQWPKYSLLLVADRFFLIIWIVLVLILVILVYQVKTEKIEMFPCEQDDFFIFLI